MEGTEIAILPAWTRGLGQLGYIWSFVANVNQSRSTFIQAPNFYCQFCCTCLLAFSSHKFLCTFSPQLPAPQLLLAGWGISSLLSLSGCGFSYPAVSYLVSFTLEDCFSS